MHVVRPAHGKRERRTFKQGEIALEFGDDAHFIAILKILADSRQIYHYRNA